MKNWTYSSSRKQARSESDVRLLDNQICTLMRRRECFLLLWFDTPLIILSLSFFSLYSLFLSSSLSFSLSSFLFWLRGKRPPHPYRNKKEVFWKEKIFWSIRNRNFACGHWLFKSRYFFFSSFCPFSKAAREKERKRKKEKKERKRKKERSKEAGRKKEC